MKSVIDWLIIWCLMSNQQYFSHIKVSVYKHVGVKSVCLSHSRIFHSYWNVTVTGEGLQIFTYAPHSWPLSSEGSLACHTYCDRCLPFIIIIPEDPWHSYLFRVISSEAVTTCFYDCGWNSNTQPSTCKANALTHCATAVGMWKVS